MSAVELKDKKSPVTDKRVELRSAASSSLVSPLQVVGHRFPLVSGVSVSSATCRFRLLPSSAPSFSFPSLFLLQTRPESPSPIRPSGIPRTLRQTTAAACSANFFDFSLKTKRRQEAADESARRREAGTDHREDLNFCSATVTVA